MHGEAKHSEVRDDLGERGQLIHDVHDDVQFAVLAQQGMRRAVRRTCCDSGHSFDLFSFGRTVGVVRKLTNQIA